MVFTPAGATGFSPDLRGPPAEPCGAARKTRTKGGESSAVCPGCCPAAHGSVCFQLAGSAVVTFGLWLRFGGVMGNVVSEQKSPEYIYMGLYVLVGAGALMMMVGFFGCCGAVRESQCLLGAFFACLLVIFAAEVTSGVFAFLGKNVAIQEVQAIYKDAYDAYMKNPGEKNTTLQLLHSSFQCCGKGKDSDDQVKPTCPEGIHLPKNCLEEIQSVTNSHLHLVGIVGIAIAGITIFGMIFSMVLCCAIRNTRDTL
ncbi:PREDICTED: tetraspanin-2 [Gavialis gangeticus]|uniref:tetraspanin-2 n=1 Tax=Gavialis gangeticus TaxID=94835 RepID=UPI00092F773A|nr:PREDICTED: tetraspanin-2 [Gavialis gangeticus]